MICDYCGKTFADRPFMEIVTIEKRRNLCVDCVSEIIVKHFIAIDKMAQMRDDKTIPNHSFKLPQNSP